MDVNTATQMVRLKKRDRIMRATDAARGEKKNNSICGPLKREPFKIRYLKHPSFARYSSYGQGQKQRIRRDRNRQSEIKGVRQQIIKFKNML